jgi:hypothetical protein
MSTQTAHTKFEPFHESDYTFSAESAQKYSLLTALCFPNYCFLTVVFDTRNVYSIWKMFVSWIENWKMCFPGVKLRSSLEILGILGNIRVVSGDEINNQVYNIPKLYLKFIKFLIFF